MLYTIVPSETIFEDEDEQKPRKHRTLVMNGVQLVVEEADDDQYQVVQLISSNPHDFLDEQYQPGKMIRVGPLLNS
ncbi:YlzJ-like family protein [Tuberibacillus sp. Marseille-P3662]|uniref:YlzJ-like family protein n=1 Tax=Tuberibacillus sp. Marseille-P3662 TaxID=1965358 RepID=UPI000A1CB4D3|nr:YlzJ-like family protein [Tuberibacillus sp. Marseille-P3662]